MNSKHPHVLMIDDNRHGMIARRGVLEEAGFQVTTAASGAAGLRAFEANEFDVVVTDYRMPKMDGLQVLRKVRELRPHTPVVILSGCIKQLGLKEELSLEADAVLFKGPSEVDDLLRAVSRIVKRRAASERRSKQAKAKRRGA